MKIEYGINVFLGQTMVVHNIWEEPTEIPQPDNTEGVEVKKQTQNTTLNLLRIMREVYFDGYRL